MKVQINGKEYIVNWKHGQIEGGELVRAFTSCLIKDMAGLVISMGQSACSKGDMFNKETGRKISLTRALKSADFDRETRAMFWKVYLDRKGK